MKEFRCRESCFKIESKEYELNLHCERRFICIIGAYMNTLLYSSELQDSLSGIKYDTICKQLTVDMLTQFKDMVYKDRFGAFVRVRSDRSVVGERINTI